METLWPSSFNYEENGLITQYIITDFFIKCSSVTFDLLFLVTRTCCLLGGQFVGELSRTVERLGMYDRIVIRRTCSRRGRYSISISWFTYYFGFALIIIPPCIDHFFQMSICKRTVYLFLQKEQFVSCNKQGCLNSV